MYSENATIIDVKQTGEEEYCLNMTARDLYICAQSGNVIRRHDVSASDVAPEHKYVDLTGVKLASGTYTFTFANGDEFSASSDTAYPTAESVSDATGGGSGGGVLVVTDTDGTLDKTWQEIHDAAFAVVKSHSKSTTFIYTVVEVSQNTGESTVYSVFTSDESEYLASSTSGYPELQS